jgi:hypothetical protein
MGHGEHPTIRRVMPVLSQFAGSGCHDDTGPRSATLADTPAHPNPTGSPSVIYSAVTDAATSLRINDMLATDSLRVVPTRQLHVQRHCDHAGGTSAATTPQSVTVP